MDFLRVTKIVNLTPFLAKERDNKVFIIRNRSGGEFKKWYVDIAPLFFLFFKKRERAYLICINFLWDSNYVGYKYIKYIYMYI